MTRQETAIIMDILATAYPGFYSGPNAPSRPQTLSLWAEMFADDGVALVAAAVKNYIACDQKGFPPHIGAIKNAMHALTAPDALQEDQAWELLRAAASRSAYGAKEEFARLPEFLQKLAGSPSQLYEWSQMDSEVFNSVVSSNFRRAYRARQESRRRDALLPGDIKRAIAGLAPSLALPESVD